MASTEAVIKWFVDRLGKVRYSMSYLRTGPNYYDCSSAVFSALIAGGFRAPGSLLGSTETLYSLEGSLLIPISANEARRGDIFVAGYKGGSGGSAGHTGVHYGNGQIIHCNYADNGISITGISGRTGSPLYWYRLAGGQAPGPTPSPEPETVEEIVLPEEYIDNDYLISIYGIRMETETFDNVDNETDLRQKAKEYLEEQLEQINETTVTALDLSLIDENFEKFKLGNTYVSKIPNMLTNGQRRVIRRVVKYDEPQRSELTLGTSYQHLSDYILTQRRGI